MPIIKSTLDQDLYKFNMAANILRHHPRVPVKFRFNNRRREGKFNGDFEKAFKREVALMGDIKADDDELQYLAVSSPHLPPQMIDFIKNFRFDPRQVTAKVKDGELDMDIDGHWETATMWEVPGMSLISELFFIHCDSEWRKTDWIPAYENRTIEKANKLRFCLTSDFGTRRRRSYDIQNMVVGLLKQHHPRFVGTSNVHLAHKHKVKPIGTMAHELIMGYSVLEGLQHANRYMLRDWADTFKGNMGIALPDTFGLEAFLKDFSGIFSRIFDGVRHDSGDPHIFGHRIIKHYKSLGINPITKTIVFSDGLSADLAADLEREFKDLIQVAFGIGTHFTNDFGFLNSKALNMVIKLWSVFNGHRQQPVVKLGDGTGKRIGDKDALRVAEWLFFGTPLDG